MHVTRFKEAKAYETKGHFAMMALRLQGFEASAAETCWVGLSHFLPGGGAESSATPIEKIYMVLEGEVTVVTDAGETTLHKMDSCLLAPGERRSIVNKSNAPASMLVIMPYPDGKRPK